MPERPLLTVILPVYNERDRLIDCVDRLESYLAGLYASFEIIIVEDHSPDESYEAACVVRRSYDNVVLIRNERRLGRGASLVKAINAARSDYVVYMDVDLATDIYYTRTLVNALMNGASVTTGSRLKCRINNRSQASRPMVRDIASRSYNRLVRRLFGSKLYDHQCGFKGFNKKDIVKVIGQVRDSHWFWDTELLILCQRLGMTIYEFPVKWKHNGGDVARISKVKVLKDSFFMAMKLLQLKYRLVMHPICEPK